MQTEPAVPLFVAVDQEGGDIASAPWVAPQPAAAEVGSRGDPEEAHDIAATMGRQLLRAGINTNFAPVVDTGFGAAIGNRSYGEDPELVARMGAAAVEGFERADVISAAKHFPNHGPATSDSHTSLPVIRHDAKTLESHDLPPFEAAVDAGVPMVMVGHLLYPAIDPHNPASLSRDAIGVLRRDLGFDGVIVTDDLAMAGASGSGTPAEAAVQAVQAGADLLHSLQSAAAAGRRLRCRGGGRQVRGDPEIADREVRRAPACGQGWIPLARGGPALGRIRPRYRGIRARRAKRESWTTEPFG